MFHHNKMNRLIIEKSAKCLNKKYSVSIRNEKCLFQQRDCTGIFPYPWRCRSYICMHVYMLFICFLYDFIRFLMIFDDFHMILYAFWRFFMIVWIKKSTVRRVLNKKVDFSEMFREARVVERYICLKKNAKNAKND